MYTILSKLVDTETNFYFNEMYNLNELILFMFIDYITIV